MTALAAPPQPTLEDLVAALAVFPYARIAYVEFDEAPDGARISRVIDREDGDITKRPHPGPVDHDGEHTFLGRLQEDPTLAPLVAALHVGDQLPAAVAIPGPAAATVR